MMVLWIVSALLFGFVGGAATWARVTPKLLARMTIKELQMLAQKVERERDKNAK